MSRSTIHNDLLRLSEKEEQTSKAAELLKKVKDIEKSRKLVRYQLNRNTVLLVSPKRKAKLEYEAKMKKNEKAETL